MTETARLLEHGKVSFLEARKPTLSEYGARVNQLFTDSTTGVIYTCIVALVGSQVWVGDNGETIEPSLLTSPILASDHPNLQVHYTMDNISGITLVDETPNGNDGTIIGASTITGKVGNALDFSGNSAASSLPTSYVSLASEITIAGELTISCWIDASSLPASETIHRIIVGNDDISTGDGFLEYRRQTGSLQISQYGTALGLTALDSGLSGWFHLVVTRNGDDWSVYKDGILQGTTSFALANSLRVTTVGALDPDAATDRNFLGSLDNLRIFNTGINEVEARNLYLEGVSLDILGTDATGLEAFWTMDDIDGTSLIDATGNGYDGTLVNTTSQVGIMGSSLKLENDYGVNGLPTSYFTYPTLTLTGDFALSVWLDLGALDTIQFLNRYVDSNDRAGINWNSSTRVAAIEFGITNYPTAAAVPTFSGPTHVVIQREGGVLRQYINKSTNTTGACPTSDFVTDTWGVNGVTASSSGNSRYNYDQVRVFNRALTEEEVSVLYFEPDVLNEGDASVVFDALASGSLMGVVTGTDPDSGKSTTLKVATTSGSEYTAPAGWTDNDTPGTYNPSLYWYFSPLLAGNNFRSQTREGSGAAANAYLSLPYSFEKNGTYYYQSNRYTTPATGRTFFDGYYLNGQSAAPGYYHFGGYVGSPKQWGSCSGNNNSYCTQLPDVDWPYDGVCQLVYDHIAGGYVGHPRDPDCSAEQKSASGSIIVRSVTEPSNYFKYTRLLDGGTKIAVVTSLGAIISGTVIKVLSPEGRVEGIFDATLDPSIL